MEKTRDPLPLSQNALDPVDTINISLSSGNAVLNTDKDPETRLSIANNNPVTSAGKDDIKVICRVRPISQRESNLGVSMCVEFYNDYCLSVKTLEDEGISEPRRFTFDRVFNEYSTQEEIYDSQVKPAVESALAGIKSSIIAYGQTSAGKTHTVQGFVEDPQLKGIIPRAIDTVFEHIENSPSHLEFTVKISIVDIYIEKVQDLLNRDGYDLKIRETKERGVYIENVDEIQVKSPGEAYKLLNTANRNKAIYTTLMSAKSSRSSFVFIMSIHKKNTIQSITETSKLYIVDLASSEKVLKTNATRNILREANNINKSLSAFIQVICALKEGGKNRIIPYRDSKLTRILQDSLRRDSKIVLIVVCSPSSYNCDETLFTLKFGARIRSNKSENDNSEAITANFKRNEDNRFKEEAKALENDLRASEKKERIYLSTNNNGDKNERSLEVNELQKEIGKDDQSSSEKNSQST